MNGWGPKSSVCPSKPRETKLLGGISRDFCRVIPEVPEKFEKKVRVQFLAPISVYVTLFERAERVGWWDIG